MKCPNCGAGLRYVLEDPTVSVDGVRLRTVEEQIHEYLEANDAVNARTGHPMSPEQVRAESEKIALGCPGCRSLLIVEARNWHPLTEYWDSHPDCADALVLVDTA